MRDNHADFSRQNHPRAKLTLEQVEKIRKNYRELSKPLRTLKLRENLAVEYGVSSHTIERIVFNEKRENGWFIRDYNRLQKKLLTPEQQEEIRTKYSSNKTKILKLNLAEEYKVSLHTIERFLWETPKK